MGRLTDLSDGGKGDKFATVTCPLCKGLGCLPCKGSGEMTRNTAKKHKIADGTA